MFMKKTLYILAAILFVACLVITLWLYLKTRSYWALFLLLFIIPYAKNLLAHQEHGLFGESAYRGPVRKISRVFPDLEICNTRKKLFQCKVFIISAYALSALSFIVYSGIYNTNRLEDIFLPFVYIILPIGCLILFLFFIYNEKLEMNLKEIGSRYLIKDFIIRVSEGKKGVPYFMVIFKHEHKSHKTQYNLMGALFSEIQRVKNLVVYIQSDNRSNFYIDFQESIGLEDNLGAGHKLYFAKEYSVGDLEKLLWSDV